MLLSRIICKMIWDFNYLELSSNKNELLSALLESSVINTRILLRTWNIIENKISNEDGASYINYRQLEECRFYILHTSSENILNKQNCITVNIFRNRTHIWWDTLGIILVIPVLCTNSVQLLNTQHLQTKVIGHVLEQRSFYTLKEMNESWNINGETTRE